jgi:uncharacterized membrane-anchored protein YitT (DUF2179 family)
MEEMRIALPLIGLAILAVTLVDTIGAIASRLLKFKYGWLTFLSLAVYTMLGYYCASIVSIRMALLASLIVGTYDATVGFKLSKICKANLGEHKEEMEKITYAHSLMIMAIICPLFSGIGYALNTN